ncbi:MAG: polysaccharide deacetylase family protein [Bacteroidales bacterium]|nr:polysaccharide deacetylase family protein [Bacteroidales bacterium]
MKIIVSHDVDHITASEHFKSAMIPKFIVRSKIEFLYGKISLKEILLRFSSIFKNKWNNITELIVFNKKHDIPATFFIGVNNGVGLNYNIKLAEKWIKEIVSRGVDCGVHGIAYDNLEDVKNEYDIFKRISGLDNFGIRMHYLRSDINTFNNLVSAGYTFDSTDYGIKKHYKIGEMHEFPLHIMEGYELEAGKKWQSKTKAEAVASTIEKIKDAEKNGIEYLTILFHDRYFEDSFLSWKAWYTDIIQYCKNSGYEFISYADAIKEIENK